MNNNINIENNMSHLSHSFSPCFPHSYKNAREDFSSSCVDLHILSLARKGIESWTMDFAVQCLNRKRISS
uniref:Uncharacterized protein n=1 Tax=Lepeophtheirus salmonis TaxID=72036 RepID=A0A0K2UIM1_LEPSM